MSSLIGEEIRSQDEIIDGLEGDMSGARAMLANMMKHMDRLIAQVSWHCQEDAQHNRLSAALCACSRGVDTCVG